MMKWCSKVVLAAVAILAVSTMHNDIMAASRTAVVGHSGGTCIIAGTGPDGYNQCACIWITYGDGDQYGPFQGRCVPFGVWMPQWASCDVVDQSCYY